jgi:RHS repeat-associated protein
VSGNPNGGCLATNGGCLATRQPPPNGGCLATLGSVRDIVSSAGTVLDHIDYDAYGNVTSQTDPAEGDQYLFAGMQFIAVVGLYYDHARDYDPKTGTWTTQDPMGFDAGDANLYRYVSNSPTNLTDPSGIQSWTSWIVDQANVVVAAKTAFEESIANNIVGGVKAIVTLQAGQALGERAVQIVENSTGQAFTGTTSEWGHFAGAVAGDMVGTNQLAEAGVGYDLVVRFTNNVAVTADFL